MSGSLSVEARRLALAAALTRQAGIVDELADVSHPGTRFEPPYPGVAVRTDGREVFACTAFRDDAEVGTVFTALIPGRRPSVSVAPPGTPYGH